MSSSKALQKVPKLCSKLRAIQNVAEVAEHNLYLKIIQRAPFRRDVIDSQQGA